MPIFKRDDIELYYEEHGAGFPILLIAPGGMHSAVAFWERTPWNPITQLAPHYRVIAMDQRNAGQSVAPIRATDSWHVYTTDQLALLDHLDVDRFHVAGMCIGGPYIMGLIQAAPHATLIEHWKEPEHQPAAQQAVERFLAEHTPR
jgi:pimeloyl-ACP methyl ester carboxylesterase